MQRAYSLLEVKSVDEERRMFSGVATTPSTDSHGDIIEPLGISFRNPLPLKFEHKASIGQVVFDPPMPTGVTFTASIPKVTEAGILKDRTDEAWHSVKYGVVRGASIGFERQSAVTKQLETGGTHYLKVIAREMSICAIAANREATILAIKSLDTKHLAASGPHQPSTGPSTVVRVQKAAQAMTIPEQITQFENTRAAKSGRMNELMTKSAETGSTLDQAQAEEYDTLETEVKSIDVHLTRMRQLEKTNLIQATPITSTTSSVAASDLRGGHTSTSPVITVKSNLPKGAAFTRMCMSMAASKGDSYQAIERAKLWRDTPEVELMTKAAIAAGSTTDATWAGPLVAVQPLVNEFLELLRPRTLIGRIPGLKQVPFNVSVPSQTTGGTYGWVGQNKPKPVTKADYATVTLTFAKAAGIIVLTEELVKLSTPSAENLVREEMIAGMGQFLDLQFQDPAVTAVANVNPASITAGAATAAASGVTGAAAKADFAARVATFTAAGIPLEGSVWLMSDSNAFGLGLSMNALGQPLFPGVGVGGGSIFGIPIVVSNSLSTRVVLVHAPSILFADDGGVSIDVSREASVQMDSAPTDTVDATTVYISLWQRNLIGLKAERFITWIRARTAAVTYITAAQYNGT